MVLTRLLSIPPHHSKHCSQSQRDQSPAYLLYPYRRPRCFGLHNPDLIHLMLHGLHLPVQGRDLLFKNGIGGHEVSKVGEVIFYVEDGLVQDGEVGFMDAGVGMGRRCFSSSYIGAWCRNDVCVCNGCQQRPYHLLFVLTSKSQFATSAVSTSSHCQSPSVPGYQTQAGISALAI